MSDMFLTVCIMYNYTVKYTYMQIFSNGCSFLTPRPKDNVDTYVSKIIAEGYGTDLHNIAMGGRGNKRINFTTKWWFEAHKPKDTFAIIGWSSQLRNDYITNDGWKAGRIDDTELTWRTWKTTDKLKFITSNKGWDVEKNIMLDFLENVFNLQNYFKLNKIPYVMYNALPNHVDDTVSDFTSIKKAIDMDRFFKPSTSHFEFIQQKNYVVSPDDPHPSMEGHGLWAKQLMEFIDVNNLRSSQ